MQLDTNLITSCSNVLKVYVLNDKGMVMRTNKTFNDRVIDIIRIPTSRQSFKMPSVQKMNKVGVPKSGKLSRSMRRVVDLEEASEQVQEINTCSL